MRANIDGIIVSETNRSRIESDLAKVQGRSTARTVSFEDIEAITKKIEKKLNLPKKFMEGIKVYADIHAQTFPRAYKYKAYSTHVILKYQNKKWRYVNSRRDICGKDSSAAIEIVLTESCKEEIIRREYAFLRF